MNFYNTYRTLGAIRLSKFCTNEYNAVNDVVVRVNVKRRKSQLTKNWKLSTAYYVIVNF